MLKMKKLWLAVLLGLALPALAQTYPSKPVRVVVNFPPGGAADQLGRAVAAKLQEALGQTFLVENRPGANGSIGAAEVAKSAADGHTLLMSSGGAVALNGLIYKNLGYDPMKALDPVAPVASVAVFLQVKPALPAQTLAEFITHARANPQRLNYGTPGNGSSPHLAAEMFNRAAKVSTVHVPYKGAAPALTDLLAGQIDFMFDPGIGLQHAKAGKLRLLAVGSPKRHPAYPDTPTVAEVVGSDFDADTVFGFYAPAGTPAPVVARLNAEINKALATPAVRDRIHAIGGVPAPMTPAEFAAKATDDSKRFGAIVKERKIVGD
jgi:tripartite-type tricarboxylate transporter receptor subunit TctC